MSLKRFLFGEKIILIDDFFGKMESQRTRSEAAKSLSWYLYKKIANFKNDTFIIAEGNYLGIDLLTKDFLKEFIVNFEQKYSLEIDKLIAQNDKYSKLKHWRTTHFISLIDPIDDASFEIEFELYDNEKERFIVEYFNYKLQNLEI